MLIRLILLILLPHRYFLPFLPGPALRVMAVGATCPANRDTPGRSQKFRMEAIRVQILSKLRITPQSQLSSNVTRHTLSDNMRWQMDDYYTDIRRKQQDESRNYHRSSNDYFSKTLKVFRFPEETILSPNTRHYKFDATLGQYLASGALLKMGISTKELSREPRRMSVKIYKLTSPLNVLMENGDERSLDRPSHIERVKKIKGSSGRTFDFDFQLAFSRWNQWPDTNHGILVCIGRCFQGDPSISFDEVFTGNNEDNRPLLSIDTYEENHSRKKRSGYDCVSPKQHKKCCRYPYYVRFADIGMDWILAPEGYNAYYCSGECPFMYLSEQKSSLYYTFVIARANHNNPMASPRPCCTPNVLSSLSIMYSSGKTDSMGQPTDIEIHNLEDMIVDECGCS